MLSTIIQNIGYNNLCIYLPILLFVVTILYQFIILISYLNLDFVYFLHFFFFDL